MYQCPHPPTEEWKQGYLKDKKEIEVFFRRPGLNEQEKVTFRDLYDKIEVKDVKMLRFE